MGVATTNSPSLLGRSMEMLKRRLAWKPPAVAATQLKNLSPRGIVVVSPAGMQTTSVPQPDPPPVDQEDLSAATGGKAK